MPPAQLCADARIIRIFKVIQARLFGKVGVLNAFSTYIFSQFQLRMGLPQYETVSQRASAHSLE